MKLTKRKAFNFLRSYFDVMNEIPEDKDKLSFLISIINKQFLDEDPKELPFISKLCYESQRHAIESSVKGWKRANKTEVMGDPMTDPTTNPTTKVVTDPKEEEEKEEEKEEVEVKHTVDAKASVKIDFDKLLIAFNQITNKNCRVVNSKTRAQLKARLKDGYTKQNIKDAIINCYNDKFHKENNHKHLTLEFITRPDKLERYSQAVVTSQIVTSGKGIGLKVGDFFEATTLFVSFISEEGTAVWKNTKDML